MTKTTKILLAISLTSFVLGFTDILWGVGRPFGAIFFGLFMVSKVLEKEVALFDREQSEQLSAARKSLAVASPKIPVGESPAQKPAPMLASQAR